jgi:hypothetical protein
MILDKDTKYEKSMKTIDRYLKKRGYNTYLTIFLNGYNNNHIYISFNYVEKIKAYRMVWFDLNYIDLKHLDRYISEQIMTSFAANKLVEGIVGLKIKPALEFSDDILGDRVIIKNYLKDGEVYGFDRFLPKKWSSLIDPIILVFSYVPRSMELFVNEFFAKFDNTEELYNTRKAIRFNLKKDKFEKFFGEMERDKGTKLYANSRVLFLEKLEDKYLAIVEDVEPVLVVIHEINDDFTILWCSCPGKKYCSHIYAALLALKNKSFNSFYKVRYKGDNFTLLDRVRDGLFYFCFGVNGDTLLLISDNGGITSSPIVENGKCMFEVIEDDDECSLSKYLEKYDD